LKEDLLFIKKSRSNYCQSVGKVSWDSRHLPLFQVVGTRLKAIQQACDNVSHCFGFSQSGWLYTAVAIDVTEYHKFTKLFVKQSFLLTFAGYGPSVRPEIHGVRKDAWSTEYRKWKSMQREPSVPSGCTEASLIPPDKNRLLVIAWTDFYPGQGDALAFLRKMIPTKSSFISAISGMPVHERCQKHVIVAPGDSLWGISQTYHVPLGLLMDSNPGKSPDTLKPGDELCVPPPSRHASSGPTLLQVSGKITRSYITKNRFCLPYADAVLFHAPN